MKRAFFNYPSSVIAGLQSGMHSGYYMSAHVLLNLLNEMKKRDKIRGLLSILSRFATSLINSIIQEHKY